MLKLAKFRRHFLLNKERGVSVVYREISPNETLNKVQHIFMGMGVPEKDALRTADALMNAELSGVESHGLARLQVYSSRILKGFIDPKPNIQITVDGATAKVNGGNGLGQVVAWKSTEECIKLAKNMGSVLYRSATPIILELLPIIQTTLRIKVALASRHLPPDQPWLHLEERSYYLAQIRFQ